MRRSWQSGTARRGGRRRRGTLATRATAIIEAHLADDIRIGTLASLADLSEGHFHRAFRATTGQTPLAYITARRIEAAKRVLLSEASLTTEVAHVVGFVSQSHFVRTFKSATGLTPRDYRRQFARL